MMIYRIGVEDIEPDHWLGWVLDLPGCFSAAARKILRRTLWHERDHTRQLWQLLAQR